MQHSREAPATTIRGGDHTALPRQSERGIVSSLAFLGLALFFVELSTGMFTPILPQYATQLGIDVTSLGFAYSVYNMALIVFLIPSGVLADRVGRVNTIMIGLLSFALSSLMLIFVKDLLQFAIARAIEGLGWALVTPAVFALTADLTPAKRRGIGMGFTSTMETVGGLVSPSLGGLIAQLAGLTSPFYAGFVLALLSSMLVIPIRDRRLPAHAPSRPASSVSETFASFRQNVSESRSFLVLCFRGFIVGITQGLFVLVFVMYMAFNVGMNTAEVGFSYTIVSGVALAFTFIAGHLSDRFGRKPFVITGGMVIASGVVAFSLTRAEVEVYLICFVLGLGIALNNSPINALLADCVIPEARGKVMGAYEVILGLGRAFGVLILGGLYAMSQSAPFYLLGGLMFFTAALVWLFVREPLRTLPSARTPAIGEARLGLTAS